VTLKNSVKSEKEHFVVDKLHVPVEWVHEAKVKLHSYVLFYNFVYSLCYWKCETVTFETCSVLISLRKSL